MKTKKNQTPGPPPYLLLFFLSTSLPISSSSADMYRSHVIDHFLQKAGRLDSFFGEDVQPSKENNKRGATATLSDLVSTFVKSDDVSSNSLEDNTVSKNSFTFQENPNIRKSTESVNVYEYPDVKVNTLESPSPPSLGPTYSYKILEPPKNIYRGSSSLAYHGSPTPSSYHGSPTPSSYHGSPTPSSYHGSTTSYNFPGSPSLYFGSPTPSSYFGSPSPSAFHGAYKASNFYSPSLNSQSVLPKMVTPAFQSTFDANAKLTGASNSFSSSVSFPSKLPQTVTPSSLYQSFFNASPNSVDFPTPTEHPSFSRSSHSLPNVPTIADTRVSTSSAAVQAVPDSGASVRIKPFTFFNIPKKQNTLATGLSPQTHQTSFFRDSNVPTEQINSPSPNLLDNFSGIRNQHFKPEPIFTGVIQQQRQQKSIFSPNNFLVDLNQNEINQDSVFSQTLLKSRQQQVIAPAISQFPGSQIGSLAQSLPSLFESINQPAPDREVRTQLTDKSSRRQMPKSDALQQLMNIAGDNWEHKLLTGKDNLTAESATNFVCPGPEGHFPDPESCQVYYQCAQGTAHKHTCQAGLSWNILTNQCDWEESVDCRLNSGYSSP